MNVRKIGIKNTPLQTVSEARAFMNDLVSHSSLVSMLPVISFIVLFAKIPWKNFLNFKRIVKTLTLYTTLYLRCCGLLLCLGLLPFFAARGEQIRIVDASGHTQIHVELSKRGKATVRVSVTSPSGSPSGGVQVLLKKKLSDGLLQTVQQTVTLDSGIAIFIEVSAGSYTFEVSCESLQIENLSVQSLAFTKSDSGDALANHPELQYNAVREQELLVLQNESGKELYASPLPPGSASEVIFSVKTKQTGNPTGLSARLISNDGTEGRKIVSESKVTEGRPVQLKPVFPGSYTIKVDCGARVSAVSFLGSDIVKLFCSAGTPISLPQPGAGDSDVTGEISTLGVAAGVAVVGGVAAASGGGGGGGGAVNNSTPLPTPIGTVMPTTIPTPIPDVSVTPEELFTPAPSPIPTTDSTATTVTPTPTRLISPTPTATPILTIPGLVPTCSPETIGIQPTECRPNTAAAKVNQEPLSPHR